jgi:hypothetical protein
MVRNNSPEKNISPEKLSFIWIDVKEMGTNKLVYVKLHAINNNKINWEVDATNFIPDNIRKKFDSFIKMKAFW